MSREGCGSSRLDQIFSDISAQTIGVIIPLLQYFRQQGDITILGMKCSSTGRLTNFEILEMSRRGIKEKF